MNLTWYYLMDQILKINLYFYPSCNFLAHLAKGNVSFAITWRPSSVNFSHFNLLL